VLAGPKPVFFFAPAQVKKRVQDWGARAYQERVAASLNGFVDWSREWLAVSHVCGTVAAAATWRAVHAGDVEPGAGFVVSLWD
jgi:hypothetical protein